MEPKLRTTLKVVYIPDMSRYVAAHDDASLCEEKVIARGLRLEEAIALRNLMDFSRSPHG